MTTLREHLVHIRSVHHPDNDDQCIWCGLAWPCGHLVHLNAALAILDAAPLAQSIATPDNPLGVWRYVPDASPDPQDTNT